MLLQTVTTVLADPETGTVQREETTQQKLYTIEELEQAHPKGYERAKEKCLEWIWEGYDPQETTQQVVDFVLAEQWNYEVYEIVDQNGKNHRPHCFWDNGPSQSIAFEGRVKDMGLKLRTLQKKGLLTKAEVQMLKWLNVYAETKIQHYGGSSMGCYIEAEADISQRYGMTDLQISRVQKLQGLLVEDLKEALAACLKYIDEEQEYLGSEEYIKETAEANGWMFNRHGKLVN
ncbi:MAG TPA: hypothetical protein VGE45_00975 [Chloroflexia bacterium]|jgi:hypothetical protein